MAERKMNRRGCVQRQRGERERVNPHLGLGVPVERYRPSGAVLAGVDVCASGDAEAPLQRRGG